jgi:Heterokaryon incompatibility protein (HET)
MGRRRHLRPEQSCPEVASAWLQQCLGTHPTCVQDAVPPLPTRVIALSSNRIHLYESQGEHASYVALSHCWGGQVRVTTTSSTIVARKRRIDWEELSTTFQDAITMTLRLGMRYIWIDSLCIVQDNQKDWELESARMASVYHNATLTIAASGAANGDVGLFDPLRRAPYIWQSPVRQFSSTNSPFSQVNSPELWRSYPIQCSGAHCALSNLSRKSGLYFRSRPPPTMSTSENLYHWMSVEPSHDVLIHNRKKSADKIISQGLPLLTRAWFLQERILSPRIVHFGQMEMYWECQHSMCCECLAFDEDRRQFLTRDNQMNAKRLYNSVHPTRHALQGSEWAGFGAKSCQNEWQMLVEEYSRLRLSHEMDRLPALSGIAACPDQMYLAGLWKNHLPSGLCWVVNHHSTPVYRPTSYRAPTFSWASIEGPIDFPDIAPRHPRVPGTSCAVAIVKEAVCWPEGWDPHGRVVGGYLKIEGWVGTASVTYTYTYHSPFCEIQCKGMTHTFMLDSPLDAGDEELTLLLLQCEKIDISLRPGHFWPATVYYHVAVLVLKPSRTEDGALERVGLLWYTTDSDYLPMGEEARSLVDMAAFADAPRWFDQKKTIKIV